MMFSLTLEGPVPYTYIHVVNILTNTHIHTDIPVDILHYRSIITSLINVLHHRSIIALPVNYYITG